jgi:hypothetical protein
MNEMAGIINGVPVAASRPDAKDLKEVGWQLVRTFRSGAIAAGPESGDSKAEQISELKALR